MSTAARTVAHSIIYITQVDSVLKEEEVEPEASANVPVPLVAAADGQVTLNSTSGPQQDLETGQRFFKLHLKSSAGWQLDGQVG